MSAAILPPGSRNDSPQTAPTRMTACRRHDELAGCTRSHNPTRPLAPDHPRRNSSALARAAARRSENMYATPGSGLPPLPRP